MMKNIIITGANSGLGFETAKKISADKGYCVILACRNPQKAETAKQNIISETENMNVRTMILDTSSLASVRAFAAQIEKENLTIDGLICNAGISPMHEGTTDQGFELVFATNHLGHFLLTMLLISHMSSDARILNVSSDMHNPPGGISWPGVEALAHPKENDRKKYSYSKLCNLYFTYELDRRLRKEDSRIIVNAFNPGFMADSNFSQGAGKARAVMVKTTMPDRYGDLGTSSDALAELMVEKEYENKSSLYYDRSTKAIRSSELSYNEGNALELWKASKKFCDVDTI